MNTIPFLFTRVMCFSNAENEIRPKKRRDREIER